MADNALITINPATGEELQRYDYMSDTEMRSAIEACHQAFRKWRMVEPEERAKIIRAVGKKLQDYKQELGDLMTREMGKVRAQGDQEVDLCTAICEYTADNGPAELKPEERDIQNGKRGLVVYSPIGVRKQAPLASLWPCRGKRTQSCCAPSRGADSSGR